MEARRTEHRLRRSKMASLRNWGPRPDTPEVRGMADDVCLDCGWGRLIFAHTFERLGKVAEVLADEEPGRRDIAIYIREPHVVLADNPQELFLDPSHTYRLWLDRYRPASSPPKGFGVRKLRTPEDEEEVNRIYMARRMARSKHGFQYDNRHSRVHSLFLAEDLDSGQVVGTVTGIDHKRAFGDPEEGSSLWCLAVDPQTVRPGVGEVLVRHVAEHFAARGRTYLDLSVMHDNVQAIALYEKLGFERVPVFCVKRRNKFNESLYVGHFSDESLNPYAEIIVNEARRRGIGVDVLDAEGGFFRLSFGGRAVTCREALSEMTTAVAMSLCDDKSATRRALLRAGLSVPAQTVASGADLNARFLEQQGRVVVKLARGEQGVGISVDIATEEEVEGAIGLAKQHADKVLLEQYVEGKDLRIVVIGGEAVAAAVRCPPRVVGDGSSTIRHLIERQSRRRAAATSGESTIPLDVETERCVRIAGYSLDDVLECDAKLDVRKTANLHTGGTIHDVTAELHPALAAAAVQAAEAIDIPVTGLDFIVPDVAGPDYWIIEANERPGLANHEPQPTAERFVDFLFPQTKTPERSA
ncbi:MAG: N-acetylglutaminylglutamine synthetase [Proteobacteria bacterium]|nr:N-acetylglutaminylglutamine synthetase [Pseudomonadota bacterium]